MGRRYLPILMVALATGGCYNYVSTDLPAIEPPEHVRLRLTETGVSGLLAFADARSSSVSGRILAVSPDSVTVVLRTPVAYREAQIPRSAIVEVQERRLDKKKSFLLSAGAVAAVGIAAYLGFEGKNNVPPGEGGEPPEARIPLVRFNLPFGGGR